MPLGQLRLSDSIWTRDQSETTVGKQMNKYKFCILLRESGGLTVFNLILSNFYQSNEDWVSVA